MKVLLLNNQLSNYTGSEVQILELYRYFKQNANEVHVHANHIDLPFCAEFEAQDIIHDINTIDVTQYDFIWNQHALFSRLFKPQTPAFQTRLISAHLSPYETLELSSLPYMQNLNAHFIANSQETANKMRTLGIENNIIISHNAAPSHFITPPQNKQLKKIAVISNHLPDELNEAIKQLRQQKIKVDIFGINHTAQAITPKLIQQYDAIISIGKSVQYALLANRALYCYDHFGGCGYLNSENYATAKAHNFSGRGGFGRKTAQEIADEIIQGFTDNLQFVQNLQDKDDFILENLMQKITSLPPITITPTISLLQHQAAEEKLALYYRQVQSHMQNHAKQWKNKKRKYLKIITLLLFLLPIAFYY